MPVSLDLLITFQLWNLFCYYISHYQNSQLEVKPIPNATYNHNHVLINYIIFADPKYFFILEIKRYDTRLHVLHVMVFVLCMLAYNCKVKITPTWQLEQTKPYEWRNCDANTHVDTNVDAELEKQRQTVSRWKCKIKFGLECITRVILMIHIIHCFFGYSTIQYVK